MKRMTGRCLPGVVLVIALVSSVLAVPVSAAAVVESDAGSGISTYNPFIDPLKAFDKGYKEGYSDAQNHLLQSPSRGLKRHPELTHKAEKKMFVMGYDLGYAIGLIWFSGDGVSTTTVIVTSYCGEHATIGSYAATDIRNLYGHCRSVLTKNLYAPSHIY